MTQNIMRLLGLSLLLVAAGQSKAQTAPIQLHVDLRDAPRHLLHAHLEIPVSSGPLTLEYPEWIPGDHRPTGPIDNLAGIFIRANGQDLPWRRDDVDMYGIHVEVPAGVTRLEVALDFLATPGATGSDEDEATSANMTVLEWNSVVMYPAKIPVAQIPVTASITIPADWKLGTALSVAGQTGAETTFAPVSIEHLIDTPVISGRSTPSTISTSPATPHRTSISSPNSSRQ
jgi:predicted metalloprotease with PDZ domain